MHTHPTARRGTVAAAAAVGLVLAGCTDGDDDTTATGDGQWCSDVDIVAFPGGPEGGPFASVVHNGYRAAEDVLGANVRYYFSDWDEETMISQFREAMALEPDGMAVMGHPGDEAMGPLIDEAYAQGTQVTVVNVELPESQSQHATDGLGYIGASNYDAGRRLAEEAIDRTDAGPGEEAFVWGLRSQAGRGERTRGVVEGFEDAGIEVVYEEINAETNADAQAGTSTFTGVMSANPDVSIVVTDHGALTAAAETYMTAAGMEAGDVYFAGFDVAEASVEAIKSGYLQLVIDQQPYLQGFLPILQICMTQKYGFSGLNVDTAGSFMDESNVEFIEELAREGVR